MVQVAARYGHLELMQFLCGEGGFIPPFPSPEMGGAMRSYTRKAGKAAMVEATRSGNLELVQWLRVNGCPWDAYTCYFAVQEGHVEVLRWLRENGCPWDAETREDAAAELGYTDDFGNVFEWDDE